MRRAREQRTTRALSPCTEWSRRGAASPFHGAERSP
jgi:hypothetical protein